MSSNNNKDGAVAGDTVLLFVDVERQMQEDVKYSTLLAQLSASKKYSKASQSFQWYAEYQSTLETLGWIAVKFAFVNIGDAKEKESADVVVLETAMSFLSRSGYDVFESGVKALKEQSEPRKILNHSAIDGKVADFRMGICTNTGGNPSLQLGYFHYSVSKDVDDAMFFKWGDGDVKFTQGNQTMVLNSSVYEQIRDPVIQKLGPAIKEYIREIKL
ncbi:hypothetical protein VNI00_014757 [Paramarasmius palmivorus]|uniref:Lipoprotein n=1 Tax=Paramarasmius palmivorus TaxID=297713 RepID=A0AAW0BP65_9AGAR